MRVIRARMLILLCLLYAALLFLLYHHFWHSQRNDTGNLFDVPGEDDLPHISNDVVQFNFKRRNGPPLLESNDTFDAVFNSSLTLNGSLTGDDLLLNSSQVPSYQAPVLERPRIPDHSISSRYRIGVENSSVDFNEGDTSLHSSKQSTTSTLYDVSYLEPPNYCIHAFYYMWYGSPEFDGRYLHWNHRYLPHWQQSVTNQHPKGRHVPPDDIGANFYPELGCYSSKDPKVIEAHMFQLRKAKVGVVSVSWYPPGLADDEGIPPDALIPLLLDIAHKYAIKVTLHLEPHDGRNPQNVRENLAYIRHNYFNHPAFYKHKITTTDSRYGKTMIERQLPVVYIYDSYKNEAREWAKIFKHDGEYSIRGTDIDCIAIALLVDSGHKQFVLRGGFDGFYTYFASDRFSYGSSPSNWAALSHFARENNLIFIPSFGPGYDDTRVRPWNKENTKLRRGGKYYTSMFKSAIQNGVGTTTDDGKTVKMVSLTSFNEWHEGTQIEPAVPKRTSSSSGSQYSYVDYSPYPSTYYLRLTHDTSASLHCSL